MSLELGTTSCTPLPKVPNLGEQESKYLPGLSYNAGGNDFEIKAGFFLRLRG
jgi:hypothetical protein